MGIRALCAAAVVAIGAGQAEAASVHEIMFEITRAELVYDPRSPDETYQVTDLGGYWGFVKGVPTRATLVIGDYIFAIGTRIALFSGGETIFDVMDASGEDGKYLFQVGDFDYTGLVFKDGFGTLNFGVGNDPYFNFVDAVISPAPIPLPATAALLPIGIGALAIMRRRRRAVS